MMRTGLHLTVLVVCLLPVPATADGPIDALVAETGIRPGPVASREMPGWRPPDQIAIRASAELVTALRQAFPQVEFVAVASSTDVVQLAPDADAVIGICDQSLLNAASRLQWIQIFSAGADRCAPLEPIQNGRVVLTNMQKMSSPVLGEHAVAMVMALARGLVAQSKAMASGQWQRGGPITARMQSVSGKTLLVVGLGGIGTEVARRAAALGMRVTATRRSSRTGPEFVDYVGLPDELFALAADADFIVNALPLTPETEYLFDAKFFAAAKKGAIFVSVGRGRSTVTDDLVAALESGHIAAAGLDVTDPEPLPEDHRLWQMQNVIITPHVAGAGGSRERHYVLVRENVRRFIAGDALFNAVDPASGY